LERGQGSLEGVVVKIKHLSPELFSGTVDILIPFASATPYLEQAVSSARIAIDQSRKPDAFRILLCNNCVSSLSFVNQVSRMAVQYQCSILDFKDRFDICDNWNRCIESASGDFIHFLHDDDIFRPNYLDDLLDLLPCFDLVLSSYAYFSDDFGDADCLKSGWRGNSILPKSREEFFVYMTLNFFHMSAACFARSLHTRFDNRLRFSADQDFLRRYAYEVGPAKTGFLAREDNDPYVLIREHPHQDQRQNNISLLASSNLCSLNSRLISRSLRDGLSPAILGYLYSKQGHKSLRVLSSYDFSWPILKSINMLFSFVFNFRFSGKIFLNLVSRILFQRLIWFAKINIARIKSL